MILLQPTSLRFVHLLVAGLEDLVNRRFKLSQGARDEGYALVGVEQTSESVSLPDYAFKRRTVLLLGAEVEGIPAHLLQLLDACVEIPQSGLLRSLNVHVSGAIAVYEHARQART